MSLLDDARRLLALDSTTGCSACDGWGATHEPDCSWLALPRIVAALEAAERLVGVWREMHARTVRRSEAPWPAVATLPRAADLGPDEQAARRALVDALSGPTESPESAHLTGTTS